MALGSGRHCAPSSQNEAGPDLKNSTPSGPDKTSLSARPWLPAPTASTQAPAIFMTVIKKKNQSHLKRSNNNTMRNTGVPYGATLIQRWCPQMAPEHSM